MAWTAPTIDDFKTRYPEFVGIADPTLQMILDEAIAEVGDTWVEKDRTPAVLSLTAHMLASQGLGAPSAGGGGVAVTGAVKRRKVGDVEVEFAGVASEGSGNGALSGYRTTMYGRRYLELMRKSFPAVYVV
ncbi:putative structural protein [Aminobacter phage Erebus]|nr:putative structural protein [Aminobacter phage Erebus]